MKANAVTENEVTVRTVWMTYKIHVDLGFTVSTQKLMHDQVNWQIPGICSMAQRLHADGHGDWFCWTLPTWLVWESLESKNRKNVAAVEAAIERGDIAWSAAPFTPHAEYFDPSLYEHAIKLCRRLDARFGTTTLAAKFTDVPGLTVGAIRVLAQNGIRLVQIGVNHMSAVPVAPPAFRWRDRDGHEIVVLLCRGYGNTARFPGSDVVLSQQILGDNMEAPSVADIEAVVRDVQAVYPEAQVRAGSYSDFAAAVLPFAADLPVVTGEIGDSWIHGCGTDPVKTAAFRELSRLRRRWIEEGQFDSSPDAVQRFSDQLMLVGEHTWGVSHSPHLGDAENLANRDFHRIRHRGKFRFLEASWQEQRDYLELAVEALDGVEGLKTEADAALTALQVRSPTVEGYTGFEPTASMTAGLFEVGFDPQSGAIAHLSDRTGRVWATSAKMLARFRYQTFGYDDFERYICQYCNSSQSSIRLEFGKGDRFAEVGAQSCVWPVAARDFYRRETADEVEVLVLLAMPVETIEMYGGAREVWLRYVFPKARPVVEVTFGWIGKTATRLPEAYWLSFDPLVAEPEAWWMDKMGCRVSPCEVIENGGHKLHGILSGVGNGNFMIESLDAALVAPGAPALTVFDNRIEDLRGGMHFNLVNNIWNTNFPAWYDDDAQFRFVVHMDKS